MVLRIGFDEGGGFILYKKNKPPVFYGLVVLFGECADSINDFDSPP
jgi:hypothetical protein